jgi:hypothetical protein
MNIIKEMKLIFSIKELEFLDEVRRHLIKGQNLEFKNLQELVFSKGLDFNSNAVKIIKENLLVSETKGLRSPPKK